VLLAVIILFCLAGLFSWVVAFILPSNYNAVQWILIACLGYPLFYTLSETTVVGIGVTRRSGFAMLAAVSSLLVNFLGNLCLIPLWGAAGAAVSTCVSFWVFFILRTEFAIYVWKKIPRVSLYSYSFFLILGAVINSLFGNTYSLQLKFFWLLMLLSTFFSFKKEFLGIKGFLRSFY